MVDEPVLTQEDGAHDGKRKESNDPKEGKQPRDTTLKQFHAWFRPLATERALPETQ